MKAKDSHVWKSEQNYEYTKSHQDQDWAWEFLRRNPIFRSDFEKAQVPATIYTPPRLADESQDQWVIRCVHQGLAPESMAIKVALRKKWRIRSGLVDPWSTEPPAFDTTYPKRQYFIDEVGQFFEEKEGQGPVALKDGYEVLVFERSMSVTSQLKLAESILREAFGPEKARKGANMQGDVFRTYIRLLDALDAGCTSEQIKKDIDLYGPYMNGSDKASASKLSQHSKKAQERRDAPLQLIGLQPLDLSL